MIRPVHMSSTAASVAIQAIETVKSTPRSRKRLAERLWEDENGNLVAAGAISA